MMTPRNQIHALDLAAKPSQVAQQLATSYHTRLPVFEHELDLPFACIVCDGMGGHNDGEKASLLVAKGLARRIVTLGPKGIANSVREQSANHHGSAQQSNFWFERGWLDVKAILKQDRVVAAEPLEPGSQETKSSNCRQ